MQFFCTENELNHYAAKMGLDMTTVVKADIHLALKEAYATFAL